MQVSNKQDHDHDEDDCEAVSGSGHMPEMMDKNSPIWVNKFTEDSARSFVKQLFYQSKSDPTAPIIVYIDSDGGEVYALLSMIAAMEQVPNQVITCAMSKAMSAGAMLLACGDIRFASEHATIMIHKISSGAVGHIDDINVQYANITKLNDKLIKLIIKKSKFKGGANALKKQLASARDLYFDVAEAKKHGFIDHIGIPTLHKSISMEYVLTSNPRNPHKEKS